MHLEELVTENLLAKEDDSTLLDIFRSSHRVSPDECLRLMINYREMLQDIPRNKVVAETTRVLLALRGIEEPFHSLYFLYALDYQEEGTPASLHYLCKRADEWIKRMEQAAREKLIEAAVGSFEGALDRIQSIWEEETVNFLVDVTGKQPSSVLRWLRSGRAAKESQTRVFVFARLAYVLQEEKGWTPLEIRTWAKAPGDAGQSPIGKIRSMPAGLLIPKLMEKYFQSNGFSKSNCSAAALFLL